MVLCETVIIFAVQKSHSIRIEIDLPEPYPQHEEISDYLHEMYNRRLPESGWVPRAHLEFLGKTCFLELGNRIWLLPTLPKKENKE